MVRLPSTHSSELRGMCGNSSTFVGNDGLDWIATSSSSSQSSHYLGATFTSDDFDFSAFRKHSREEWISDLRLGEHTRTHIMNDV